MQSRGFKKKKKKKKKKRRRREQNFHLRQTHELFVLIMTVATETQVHPAATHDIAVLLENIRTSLSSAASSLPVAGKDDEAGNVTIQPPQDGISLLDVKNEILLSYLHNFIFLILFQLRNLSSSSDNEESLGEEAVRKLVELRAYLDRGVKPLEGRLKYQVDKVIKAAEDAERARRGSQTVKDSKAEGSGEDESSSGDKSGGSEEDSDGKDEENDIDDMAYRPNVSALSKSAEWQAKSRTTKAAEGTSRSTSDGIYRPPKIMPTALPSTEDRREREERRKPKSNVIDEFVSAEMSSAPVAEASVGSAIRAGGRHTRTRKEKEDEAERQAFEETHFMRLPKESKKERAKKRRGRGGPEATFGGEEWRGLGEGADRISRLTRQSKGSGSALERSRKRKPMEDGPRSDGASVGNVFEKRRKKIDSWKR